MQPVCRPFNGLVSEATFDMPLILLTLLTGQNRVSLWRLCLTTDETWLNTLVVLPSWDKNPSRKDFHAMHAVYAGNPPWQQEEAVGSRDRRKLLPRQPFGSHHAPKRLYAGPTASFSRRNVTAHLISAGAGPGRDYQP